MITGTMKALIAVILSGSIAGCSNPGRTSSNALPSAPTPAAGLDTFLGTWTSAPAFDGASSVPNVCRELKYEIGRAGASQSATVAFNATCAGIAIAGTGAGSLSGSTLTWSTAGTVSRGGTQFCTFDFKNNTATFESANAIRVTYSGTVCGVPVNGSQLVQRH